jgi:ankyrin repeat protein
MAKQTNDWSLTAKSPLFLPYIFSDPLHNLALFGHENLIVEFYNSILANLKENDTVLIPYACMDVIYDRDFEVLYNSLIEDSNVLENMTEDSNDLEPWTLIDYVEESDNLGWSPLHWSACLGKLAMLKKITSITSNIHVENQDGLTALHLSCIKNHPDCVNFLLENGAKMLVNAPTLLYCNHPLHMTVYHGSTDALHILLDHIHAMSNPTDRNLTINYTDENLETALHIACAQNRWECVLLLVEYCIDVNLLNIDGKTALDIAKVKNHTHCIAILNNNNPLKSIYLYS